MTKKNNGRAIRDTDIVYSAATVCGAVRFALRPVLHSEAYSSESTPLAARAIVVDDYTECFQASCLSPGCSGKAWTGPWVRGDGYMLTWADGSDGQNPDDGWLDWLAEGEPGRGGA